VRTWAPRGQTPVPQHHFNWKVLSAAAGVAWWNFYFRLYPGAIHATEVIDFLGHLLRHRPGKLLVVWDGLPQHRARLVREFICGDHRHRFNPGRESAPRIPEFFGPAVISCECSGARIIARPAETRTQIKGGSAGERSDRTLEVRYREGYLKLKRCL